MVAYIPNNAYLVRLAPEAAQSLSRQQGVQAVLPYEPYYKLKSPLLSIALGELKDSLSSDPGSGVGPQGVLGIKALVFPGAEEQTVAGLKQLGIEVLAEENSPLGKVLTVRAMQESVAELAGLTGIYELELAARRVPANDLTRVGLGVAPDPITATNYLGLTGKGVMVNINDTGVDATQADLAGRVTFDSPSSGTDINGHGTHVAGIIAGSGVQSLTVSSATGSTMPPQALQFRGLAPAAGIYSVGVDLEDGPASGDSWVQQTAARTNVLISNNSWLYSGANSYNIAAASYDAAVRDALPGVPGSQPLLFVFASGNAGGGSDNGTGGKADSVLSPATAKNVLTIGAVEHPRLVTNQTWTCAGGPGCQTNEPWLGLTDSSSQVARFSSRGNVGINIEGEFGRIKPDVVAPGTFIVSARSAQWDPARYYAQSNNFFCPAPDANSSMVLSNLNAGLGPYYRFESGTSLAAAAVSGVLALMEEFFEQRLRRTNSPALMKALVINGARSLGGSYDLDPHGGTNFQGWGLLNLSNCLPAALTNPGTASSPVLIFDQDSQQALTTGQGHTRFVSLSPAARNQPLRVTLAWTDPPGSPVAGIKLVNDLDLVVTNLDTGEVFLGNDFPAGSEFSAAWDPSSAPNYDFINNVENVYLAPPLGSNFSVTVSGRRVCVNAVNENAAANVQDYALVVSSGNGQIPDALTLNPSPPLQPISPLVVTITNGFSPGSGGFGGILLHERIGDSAPLASATTVPLPGSPSSILTIGSTNQWRFYVFSNDLGYTNVAFVTFEALKLSLLPDAASTGAEADIDLYVSTDPGLTNLDPNALANVDVSASRSGTETVAYSNAVAGPYYVAVKCESQEGADYGFAAIASETPFSQSDSQGNVLLEGVPAPVAIPGGLPTRPGLARVFGIMTESFPLRRAIVTNTMTSLSSKDLEVEVTHGNSSAVLENFTSNGILDHQALIYDDSGEGDVPGAKASAGPGTLLDFSGGQAFGQWRLSLLDTNQAATNDHLEIFLEQQPDLSAGATATILPGACRQDYQWLVSTATNLTVVASFNSGTGPLSMQVCPREGLVGDCLTIPITDVGTNATIIVDLTTHPPLNPGLYTIRVCNLGPDPAEVSIGVNAQSQPSPPPLTSFVADAHASIPDDAVFVSTLEVTNAETIRDVEVGVRIDHPRVSDLALSLIGPDGTRVLLEENRGGASKDGLGCSIFATNAVPVTYSGGPEAVTNVVETGRTSGVISIAYDFYSLPDAMHIYYDGRLLFDSGPNSGKGATNLAYGPGLATSFTIVMNEGGNADSNTAWFYNVTTARLQPIYLTFTEDTNLASVPIKFAGTPLTNFNFAGSAYRPENGIFFLPEESLKKFCGKAALGKWKLEVWDRLTGGTDPTPTLLEWQLALRFRNVLPLPIPLSSGTPVTNILGPGQIQWFAVDAPPWVSFATNSLWGASAPVNFLFNQESPPTGTNAGDFALLSGLTTGIRVLQTNGLPPLMPGTRSYLGVQNTNTVAVSFGVQVDFDIPKVITLENGVPYTAANLGLGYPADYYRFVVSTNAVRAQFEINAPTADMTLVARKGLPLPGLHSFDYFSANPWTNDEVIVVYDYSKPIPLSAGEWFLSAVNATGALAGYSVMATEFSTYGTNIEIIDETLTSSNICLTWTSLPFSHYYLEGKTSFSNTDWVILSPTLTANDIFTTYCLDLPSPFAFFRLQEGLVIAPPPLLISSVLYSPGGVLLQWPASTNAQFEVQWSPTVAPPAWTSFTNRIVSPNGDFSFLDDGSQSGGLGASRFYRLLQLP